MRQWRTGEPGVLQSKAGEGGVPRSWTRLRDRTTTNNPVNNWDKDFLTYQAYILPGDRFLKKLYSQLEVINDKGSTLGDEGVRGAV